MNAWLKRCIFNLDLNRESVSEPRTLSGRLFQSLGARYEKVLPPLVDFAILGTTKSPEFCDLRELYVFKALHGLAPIYISELLVVILLRDHLDLQSSCY